MNLYSWPKAVVVFFFFTLQMDTKNRKCVSGMYVILHKNSKYYFVNDGYFKEF